MQSGGVQVVGEDPLVGLIGCPTSTTSVVMSPSKQLPSCLSRSTHCPCYHHCDSHCRWHQVSHSFSCAFTMRSSSRSFSKSAFSLSLVSLQLCSLIVHMFAHPTAMGFASCFALQPSKSAVGPRQLELELDFSGVLQYRVLEATKFIP